MPRGNLTPVCVQAMALAFIGGAVGLADSWIRADQVVRRKSDEGPDPAAVLGDAPASPDGGGVEIPPAVPQDGTPAQPPADTDPADASPPQDDASGEPEAAAQPEWVAWDTRSADWQRNFITVAEAKRMIDEQDAQVIDARRQSEYEAGHIPGAVRADLEVFRAGEALDTLLVAGFAPEKVTVVYCGGGDCDESKRVAEELEFLDIPFETVFIIKAGITGWRGRGMPVEEGPGEF